jgi:phenylpropionate dioxygenase-like ring-hydroxylating dioxygenase large terminal subunit
MYKIFNNPNEIIEGWYWTIRSTQVKRGQVIPFNLMGEELAIYRGKDNRVVVLDAYCPHMGAHLAEGKVEGNSLRCFFHYWKYDANGNCTEIPSTGGCPAIKVKARTWPVEEKYGLVWIWTGEAPRYPIPYVPELQFQDVHFMLGNSFTKNCHPHVLMINAIDEHHFASVHRLPVKLYMQEKEINENCIQFSNTTEIPQTSFLTRCLSRFYKNAATYSMSYWYGSTGTVTLGPDFLHFYIMFALRPGPNGRTEGQTILITPKRRGMLGILFNRVILFLTKMVGNYFASGDTRIFQTIRFDLKNRVKADHAVLSFMRHTERQRITQWGFAKKDASSFAGSRNGQPMDEPHSPRQSVEAQANGS